MSKDIWHTTDENPDANVGFACYRNLSHVENCTYLQNGGFQPTGSWAYIKDILALETDLERTRKALDVTRHAIGWINQMIDEQVDKQAIKIKCEYALQEITALEQKE